MAALSAGELDAGDGPRITSSCYCSSKVCKLLDSDLANPALEGADLQGVIASGGEALQLQEDVAAAPLGVGNQRGGDLLPLPYKGVFLHAPPAHDAFSPYTLNPLLRLSRLVDLLRGTGRRKYSFYTRLDR
jgi:hypothetical protein